MTSQQRLVGGAIFTCAICLLGSRGLQAEDALQNGTIITRTDLVSAKGMEGVLVLRELPPGGESGKHTQSEDEIVYVLDGSIMVEVQGKPPATLKAGQAFHTAAGQVHNVKNASATASGKALAFYIVKKGTPLEGISKPAN